MLILLLSACTGDDPVFPNLGRRCEERLYYWDRDGDGFGQEELWACEDEVPAAAVANNDDCDDDARAVNPDAEESCRTVRDDNCDGETNDGVDGETFYLDEDDDGFGTDPLVACVWPEGYAALDGDCDDGDADINPRADEVCNEVDDDCDGDIDEFVGSVYYTDSDGDGWGSGPALDLCEPPEGVAEKGGDCDDTDPLITERGLYFEGVLQEFESGDTWSFPSDGTLKVCKGTWRVEVVADGVVANILGMGTQQDTILTGGVSARPLTLLDSDVTLTGLSLVDGKADSGGCLFMSGGTLNADTVTLRDCKATDGAGAYVEYGVLTLAGSGLRDNVAQGGGGGLYALDSELTLSNTVFTNNDADSGGALYLDGSATLHSGGEVHDGHADGSGAAIFAVDSSWAGSQVTLRNNKSEGAGGGLYAESSTLTLAAGKLKANSSQEGGGAYLGLGGVLVLTGSECGTSGADDNSPNDVYAVNAPFAYSWDGSCSARCDEDGCTDLQ